MIRKRSKKYKTMKKLMLSALVLSIFAGSALAQKFAFVDTDYILQNIPSYKAAQDELDKISETWETEITAEYEEIEKMYKTYQSERVLLTDENYTLVSQLRNQLLDGGKRAQVQGGCLTHPGCTMCRCPGSFLRHGLEHGMHGRGAGQAYYKEQQRLQAAACLWSVM